MEYADVFKEPRKPVSRLVDHRVNLVDPNAVPPKLQLYQISEEEFRAVKDTIDDYLACSWIRPSSSNYGAPVIFLQKRTGELLIVIDYRLLNKQIRFGSYPIPFIDELLDCLAHAKYFSNIGLASRYHLIKMGDRHEEKTVFLTRYGIYEWLVLPLGLTNASATFLRLMNGIFHNLPYKMLLIYLNDLLVYSDTYVQHLEDVRLVFLYFCENK